ncbi:MULTISPECIES: LacI family DNA-binding transcriptional regulator [Actinomyces]|uniref:LacI family DNA-binding transcriptional regulator n=2 Tax=Actinomyces TaxID=1654 RepID=A0A853EGD1_9ACTO|nr:MULTISPECIES: LacI family DNA-binding transcriptional regulator [Actinomyces]MBF0696300.1 LacI family DNA-binding transcriptional regulator [Actinomyces bowdenii]MCR2053120.1 LacI family transcriptional regulator [Actinomyces bowdenii]MDO5063933.1 LacI family DNA-binding transcriptional regulator [Actinomyces bowdenii]NYS68473.1 LacI family DNA-binding transcriptional regulator [Actinomyces bowdenii]BDA64209.1 LacI family transcriptional regulator [Actinomyces capricornis]
MSGVRRPWRPPTLADVAARAGVSKATASRALARWDSGEASRPSSTDQVLEAAVALGYSRSRGAQPRLLALATDLSRTGYWATLSGVLAASQDLGAEMSVHVMTGAADSWRDNLLGERDLRADGVVVLEFDSPSAALLSHLPIDLPVAVAGGYPQQEADGLLRAWTDDRTGAMAATRHLVGLGHRRIAYVGVPAAGHPDPRLLGWQQVMREEGLAPLEPVAIGWSVATGMRAAAALHSWRATAVLCGNDDLALGLMAGLDRQGLRVPEDVSVVGMDDHPHAAAAQPALTTVRLDFAEVGRRAARLALGVEQGPVIEVPTVLVERDSTAPAP